jgi:hypothetical protein
VAADWDARTGWMLRYPRRVQFDDLLKLSNPRVIDSTPFYLRLIYDASHRGRAGNAFCEIAYPHRLRLPVLGRMIEQSIDQRECR